MPTGSDNRLAIEICEKNRKKYLQRYQNYLLGLYQWKPTRDPTKKRKYKMTDIFNSNRKADSIRIKVADRIKAEAGPAIELDLEKYLYDMEVSKRTGAACRALEILGNMEKDFKRLKPDLDIFNDKFEKVRTEVSAAMNKKRKELHDKIEKGHAALNKAINTGDCEDVYKFVNAHQNYKSTGKPEESSGEEDKTGTTD